MKSPSSRCVVLISSSLSHCPLEKQNKTKTKTKQKKPTSLLIMQTYKILSPKTKLSPQLIFTQRSVNGLFKMLIIPPGSYFCLPSINLGTKKGVGGAVRIMLPHRMSLSVPVLKNPPFFLIELSILFYFVFWGVFFFV